MATPSSTKLMITERFRQAMAKKDHGLLDRWSTKIVAYVEPSDIVAGLLSLNDTPHLANLARVVLPMLQPEVWLGEHMLEQRNQMLITLARYGNTETLDVAKLHIPYALWPKMAMVGAAAHKGNAETTTALMQGLSDDTAGGMLAGLRAPKSPIDCIRIVLEKANPIAISQTLIDGPFGSRIDVMNLLFDKLSPEDAGRAAVLLSQKILGERDEKKVRMVWSRLPEEYRLLSISRTHVNLFKILPLSTWTDAEMDQWVRLAAVHPRTELAQHEALVAYVERKRLAGAVDLDAAKTGDAAIGVKTHKM